MQKPWANSTSRYPAAVLAGLCLAGAFPKLGIAGLAWVAPALMLAAALGQRGAAAFRIGYVAGLTHYLTSLYWLLLIPYCWHEIPLAPAAGWLALGAYLALFPAAWVWVMVGLAPNLNPNPNPNPNSETPIPRAAGPGPRPSTFDTLPSGIRPCPTWLGRTLWALGGAAVWVALEMVLTRFLGGFPWDLLGVSQYQLVPLIQIASFTGVYGVSFLIVWFSLSLLSTGLTILQQPASRSSWMAEMFLPILLIALVFNLGFRQVRQSPPSTRTLRVTLVQPSMPQTLIWNSDKNAERLRDLLRLSEEALTNRTDLLVWPEAAIPELLRYDPDTARAVLDVARRHHLWMIVAADDFKPRANATRAGDGDFFNSSFLINRDGRLAGEYRKRSLVIFGEYVPLAHWLPFLKWFTPVQGGYTPGDRAAQFHLDDLDATTSPLICFEDVFPQIGRDDVQADTDFLVNLTNDGWFGRSAEQWQHAASGLFCAVENGVPLIRCTNNGLTCSIDPYGRIRQIFRDPSGAIYGPGFITLEVPLPPPGQRHAPTFYNRHGDLFGWTCTAVAGLVIARRLFAGGRV
ncbi:MAG TPA: apolipoprotein N-acyltransferase [Dongiaceae bacterium]|nr:apolipoprotein N-acyltransferase [Dongiaceae bacterium]